MSTTLLQSDPRVQAAPCDDCLEVFDAAVMAAREAFFSQLTHLPSGVNTIATNVLEERIADRDGAPLLPEYLPWLCADALGCRSGEDDAVAWLHIYLAIVMLDDVSDGKTTDAVGAHLAAATLLFQRGLRQAYSLSGFDASCLDALDKWFATTAGAHIDPPQDFADLGEKAVALLGPVEVFIARLGLDSDRAQRARRIAQHFASGWQGLDDITDFWPDYQSGIITPLLRDAPTEFMMPRNLLLQQLIQGGALEEALHAIRSSFVSAADLLAADESGRRSIIRRYIAAEIAKIDSVLEDIATARTGIELETGLTMSYIDLVDRSLGPVAQGS